MRKACLISVLALALLAPAGARAQDAGGNPFGPLPQPAPPAPEPPEPQPAGEDTEDDGLGGTAFWMIVGSTGLLFAGIAAFIARDMRRAAGTRRKVRRTRGTGRPGATEATASPEPAHRTGSQRAKAKAQQRAKTKAARRQRRKSRSR